MRNRMWLCAGVLLGIGTGTLRPAYGCLEVEAQGRAAVKLPQCDGVRATQVLNRALGRVEHTDPIRLEVIDDGHQTNFVLNGTRTCAGSVTSLDGLRYRGTWSYTRVDHDDVEVKFSLQPSK